MKTLSKAQQRALKAVYDRAPIYEKSTDKLMTYRQFRRKVIWAFYDDVVMVPWKGMFLGIERDGYTHS